MSPHPFIVQLGCQKVGYIKECKLTFLGLFYRYPGRNFEDDWAMTVQLENGPLLEGTVFQFDAAARKHKFLEWLVNF